MSKKLYSIVILALMLSPLNILGQSTNAKPKSALDIRIEKLLKRITVAEKIDHLANNNFMATPDNKRLNIPGPDRRRSYRILRLAYLSTPTMAANGAIANVF